MNEITRRWTAAQVRAALALVAITDDLRDGLEGLVSRAQAAERGGVTMVQVRLKQITARELLRVTRALVHALTVPVVVNDRLDIAIAAGAAGAHLGMSDLPIDAARSIAPPGFLLGASLSDVAELPELHDADYTGVGPLFGTPSKVDAAPALGIVLGAELARAGGRPAVAIGGVDASNAAAIVAAGFDGLSVIRAVLSQPEPEAAARSLRSAVYAGFGART